MAWKDDPPERLRVRELVAEGRTPDQIKKELGGGVLEREGVFNLAIEEKARRQGTLNSQPSTAEAVVRLREQPPRHRWEMIAAIVFGDARRVPEARTLYEAVRGPGSSKAHWTGRGAPPSGYRRD
jgi:hypothetical protein